MSKINRLIVFVFFAYFFFADLSVGEEYRKIEGRQVAMYIRRPPGDLPLPQTPIRHLRHCSPYSLEITATIDNPTLHGEVLEKDVTWTLWHEYFLKNVHGNWSTGPNGGYGWWIEPVQKEGNTWVPRCEKTWRPKWTVYEYRLNLLRNDLTTGQGSRERYPYAAFERGSYFKTPGNWLVWYNVLMTGRDKQNPNIIHFSATRDVKVAKTNANPPRQYLAVTPYTQNDLNNAWNNGGIGVLRALVSAPKQMIYSVEGLGGGLPLNNSLELHILVPLRWKYWRAGIGYNYSWTMKNLIDQADNIKGLVNEIEQQIYHDSECGCNKITVIGYSNGGHEVLKIAETIAKNYTPYSDGKENVTSKKELRYPPKNHTIDLFITIDPVEQLTSLGLTNVVTGKRKIDGNYVFSNAAHPKVMPPQTNIKRQINFYQQVDQGSFGFGVIRPHKWPEGLPFPTTRYAIHGGAIYWLPQAIAFDNINNLPAGNYQKNFPAQMFPGKSIEHAHVVIPALIKDEIEKAINAVLPPMPK